MGGHNRTTTEGRFSERVGAVQPRTVLQLQDMDDRLRNRIWNVLTQHARGERFSEVFVHYMWSEVFVLRLSELDSYGLMGKWDALEDQFVEADWNIIYEVVEAAVKFIGPNSLQAALEAEGSGYRLVGGKLVPITSETEIEEIEAAQSATKGASLAGVRAHLDRAVELFADRDQPDYRNSIKESISAVEGVVQLVSGETGATLGQGVKRLEDAGIKLHTALRDALSKLYGYTSDTGGIRHAMKDKPPTSAEARFLLVTASAFVNYLLALAADAGIKLT